MKKLLAITLLLVCAALQAQKNQFSIIFPDSLKNIAAVKYISDSSATRAEIKVEIGKISSENRQRYGFIFKNDSKSPLIFNWIGWGEPIFAPDRVTADPVKPGSKIEFHYTLYSSGRKGPFEKTATIRSNLGEIIIIFKGELI
ncbi:MAG: DUF1573 domain-containing protein [Bacteroidia bacterium]